MQGGVNGPSVLRGLLLDVLATRRPGRTTAAGGAGTETEQKSRREPRVRQGREGKRGEREKQKKGTANVQHYGMGGGLCADGCGGGGSIARCCGVHSKGFVGVSNAAGGA